MLPKPTLAERWSAAFPAALAAWSPYTRLKAPLLLETSAAELTTPTLMIRAGLSTVVRQEHVDHFLSIAPHVEAHVAPGIGHMLTGDANDAYAPLALAFLQRVYPAA